MTFYFLLPLAALALIVLQMSAMNLLFLGKVAPEISLLVVIYAGFYLGAIRGGILAFVFGFFMDCLSGAVTGIFTSVYVMIFFLSRVVSFRVYSDGVVFIMIFTFLCALAEGIFIILLYGVIYGLNIFPDIWDIFLPQALVAGALGPAVFTILNAFGRKVHAGDSN